MIECENRGQRKRERERETGPKAVDMAAPNFGMDNETWAEISQTIPAKDDPFLQKYLSGRDALIAQEKKQRYGL